ncbi:hypothetical protein R5R35_001128 [Gryllus longicercus]|uniref:Uncharacterized protein n=1 Tax=Gryllus longicercus TaxID=2509291 RepID=A0AAN9W405_9ORTH
MSEEETSAAAILRAHCAVLLLLLVRVAAEREEKMDLFKCCGPYEMLSGNGQYCVSAPWPRDDSLNVRGNFIENVEPSNQQWMNHWVPPSISTHHLRIIYLNAFRIYDFPERKASLRVVEEAVKWNESEELVQGIGYWRSNRVAFERDGVFRTINKPRTFSSPRRSVYSLTYCVDAALPPLAPFALYSDSDFRYEECIIKCCRPAHVVELHGNFWECESDARGNWSPDNTSLKGVLPTDVPFESSADFMTCIARNTSSTHPLRLSPEDTWASYLLRDRYHHFFFSSWETCFDYERREDKTLRETLFYCEESRIGRGIYWMLRPLCFVSASLLAVALLSVASNSSMRVKEHGWCLACHAVCLLAFNLGQVVYFMTLSNEVDLVFHGPPNHLINVCLKIGFAMYFLLMAANCWLTALCMNMALGFG